MRERFLSVRVRLVAAAVLVIAVALGVAGWALIRSVEDTQQARLRAQIEERVDTVARHLAAGANLESALQAAGPLGLVQLVDPATGEVMVTARMRVAPGLEPAVIPFRGPLPKPGEQVAAYVDDAPGLGMELETITRTVRTPRGPITVVAAAPADEVARSVAAVRRSLLFGLPVLLAMVVAAAWMIVGRALSPVEAMRREVEEITGSTLHRRVPDPGSGDEVGRLAQTMNRMLDRLEEASTRQKVFVSDASHELRSPVATIRTELEVALLSDDVAGLRPAIERALAEEARLEKLLADLLLLATVEGADAGAAPVAVHDVVTAEAARPRPVPVCVVQPLAVVEVSGRRVQLERAIANLLDNAAHHASTTVEVSLTAGEAPGHVLLRVDDDGPGVPEADRERIFERFTRLDEGRARNEGGAGLGLALVRSIVERHGGTVSVADAPAGGARFEVHLPVA